MCMCVPLWVQTYRSWEGSLEAGSQTLRTWRLKREKKGSEMIESPSDGTLAQPSPGAAPTQVAAHAAGWTSPCLTRLPTVVQNIHNSHDCFIISPYPFPFRRSSLPVEGLLAPDVSVTSSSGHFPKYNWQGILVGVGNEAYDCLVCPAPRCLNKEQLGPRSSLLTGYPPWQGAASNRRKGHLFLTHTQVS